MENQTVSSFRRSVCFLEQPSLESRLRGPSCRAVRIQFCAVVNGSSVNALTSGQAQALKRQWVTEELVSELNRINRDSTLRPVLSIRTEMQYTSFIEPS
eukprot:6462160-Amphidinium_carterae.1